MVLSSNDDDDDVCEEAVAVEGMQANIVLAPLLLQLSSHRFLLCNSVQQSLSAMVAVMQLRQQQQQ